MSQRQRDKSAPKRFWNHIKAPDEASELKRSAPANKEHWRSKAPVEPEYSAILNYHRGSRLRYPPPHRTLKTEDSAAWRRLQTGTYTNLHILHRLHPTAYRDECPWCGATPTLYHITWECTLHNIEHHDTNTTREQWEALLSSSALDDQLKLIQRAEKMARASGALD